MKKLIIAGQEFDSRLFLGTGKFHSNATMEEAILASGCRNGDSSHETYRTR